MAKIVWDETGKRLYETGVEKGVLYPVNSEGIYPLGVPWNGLVNVNESPSGAESSAQYADDIKYLNLISAEEFGATIEAFTYPPEFAECDGSAMVGPGVYVGQQGRKVFGFCYQTKIGNDTEGTDYGYKIHIVYGCQASPSEKAYGTINDSPEAITFSWEIKTTPVNVDGFKATALITVDSTKFTDTAAKAKLAALEAKLYGTENANPYLPLPAEVFSTLGVGPSGATGATGSTN